MDAGLKYLESDRLHHLDMLQALSRGTAEPVYMGADGVHLYDAFSEWHIISAASPEVSARFFQAAGDASCFCVHQSFTRDQLSRRGDFGFYLECTQTAYLKMEPPSCPETGVCELRVLTPDMAEWVNANYRQDPEELPYVRMLLERGVMTGAYVDGECAGFIGRYADGSIGLLDVRPEFRRRGIAEALLRDAVRSELRLGNVPFGQIAVGNAASTALNEKVGLTVSTESIWWLELKQPRS